MINKITMRQQLRTGRCHYRGIGTGVCPAEAGAHLAQFVGQRLNQRGEGCPINIKRRKTIADKKPALASALRVELRIQRSQYFSYPSRRGCGRRWRVTVFSAEEAGA